MSTVVLGIIFFMGTFFDIKYKALPKWFLISAFVLSLTLYGILQPFSWKVMAGGLLPGVIFLFVSFITKEAVGYGDGIFLAAAGILLGFSEMVGILLIGLLVSAVFSLFLLVFKKATRKTALPFLPFLTVGFVVSFLGR